ncbi:uncharacterized protein V1518DRAFT_415985 [Limtongia smithiae]|uniref:uncharacterized protein n=1 Tax=Limtongia smithiae TaxID=1125753 RepID=UPI0034CFD214
MESDTTVLSPGRPSHQMQQHRLSQRSLLGAKQSPANDSLSDIADSFSRLSITTDMERNSLLDLHEDEEQDEECIEEDGVDFKHDGLSTASVLGEDELEDGSPEDSHKAMEFDEYSGSQSQEEEEARTKLHDSTTNDSFAGISDNSISLPSVEPSFGLSDDDYDTHTPTPDPTIVQSVSHGSNNNDVDHLIKEEEEFLSSPQISPVPSPPLPHNGFDSVDGASASSHEYTETSSEDDHLGEDDAYDDYNHDYKRPRSNSHFDSSPLSKKSQNIQTSSRYQRESARSSLSQIMETPRVGPVSRDTSGDGTLQRVLPRQQRRVPELSETVITSKVKNINITDSAVKSFALRHPEQQSQSHQRTASSYSTTSTQNGNAAGTAPRLSQPPNTAISKLTLKEQSTLIDKLQKDNWGLQLKIYILQEELDKRSEDNVRDLRNENIEFKSINIGLNIDLKKLNRRIADLESKLRKSENEKKGGQADAASQRELEYYYELIESLRIETEKSKTMVAELQRKEGEYLLEIERLQNSQTDVRFADEISTLKSFLAQEQNARDEAQMEVEELKQELQRLKRSSIASSDRESAAEIIKLRQETRDLRRELNAQASAAESTTYENDRLRGELDDLRRSTMRSSSSATSRRMTSSQGPEEHDEIVADLSHKITEVKYIARERKMQVDVLNRENSELQDVIETLDAAVHTLKKEKESMELELAQLARESAAREAEIVTWQEDYEALSTEADVELTRLHNLLKDKNQEVNHATHDLEERVAELLAHVSDKEAENEKLNAEITSFTKLLTAIERSSMEQKRELENYVKKLAEQEATIDKLRREVDSTQHKLDRQIRASEKLSQDQDLLNDFKRKVRDFDKKARTLAEEREEALRALATRDQIIAKYEHGMKDLARRAESTERQNAQREAARKDELTRQAEQYEFKIQGLEERLVETLDRVAVLQQQATEYSSRQESLRNSLASNSGSLSGGAASSAASSLSASLNANSEKWMLRLQELEQRLKAEREARIRDRDGARQRLDELTRENDDLKNTVRIRSAAAGATFSTLVPFSGAGFARSFGVLPNRPAVGISGGAGDGAGDAADTAGASRRRAAAMSVDDVDDIDDSVA